MQSIIDGILFKSMVISGANNLANQKQMVDDLNVFPVPDGDTGTNMSMTVSAASRELLATDSTSVSEIAQIIASASLRGARGNSGVIMSQLFRGLATGVKGLDTIDIIAFAKGLKSAADTAYKAVMKPTEGTILTVAREAAEKAIENCETAEDMTSFLEEVVKGAKEALDRTPEMLPVLKQAGVVDAGGMGFLVILQGMLEALKGNPIEADEKIEVKTAKVNKEDIDTANIKFMYCTEFIINKKSANYSVASFRASIEKIGDCMLVIEDVDIVKVHIHTNNPGFVLEQAVKIGDLSNIKIDNMKIQHNETISAPKEPEMEMGVVSVANGDGIEALFNDVGVDQIVKGGQSMNPSAEDIADAVEKVNAKTVFVLPNNKNIILAAQQVCELTDKNVVVIPTKSIPQGMTAMLSFDPSVSAEDNEQAMNEAITTVKSGSVTFASRDSEMDGIEIKKDDIMGLIEGKIVTVSDNVDNVAEEIISKMLDEESTMISVYYGNGVTEEQAQELESKLSAQYKNCDIMVYYGGQPIYYYIISVE